MKTNQCSVLAALGIIILQIVEKVQQYLAYNTHACTQRHMHTHMLYYPDTCTKFQIHSNQSIGKLLIMF